MRRFWSISFVAAFVMSVIVVSSVSPTATPVASQPPPSPTPCPTGITVNPDAAGYYFEAEQYSARAGLLRITADSGASGGYIVDSNNAGASASSSTSTTDYVRYDFSLTTAGDITIDIRANGPDGSSDSFWVQVDSLTPVSMATGTSGWTWKTQPTLSLASGSHSLYIRLREDGARLDQVFITGQDVPAGGDNTGVVITCGGTVIGTPTPLVTNTPTLTASPTNTRTSTPTATPVAGQTTCSEDQVTGADYWVSSTGSDSNNGESYYTPKRTIQAAVDLAWPGDTVIVNNPSGLPGFGSLTTVRSGTSGNPITICAGGTGTTIDGRYFPNRMTLQSGSSAASVTIAHSYIRLWGFDATSFTIQPASGSIHDIELKEVGIPAFGPANTSQACFRVLGATSYVTLERLYNIFCEGGTSIQIGDSGAGTQPSNFWLERPANVNYGRLQSNNYLASHKCIEVGKGVSNVSLEIGMCAANDQGSTPVSPPSIVIKGTNVTIDGLSDESALNAGGVIVSGTGPSYVIGDSSCASTCGAGVVIRDTVNGTYSYSSIWVGPMIQWEYSGSSYTVCNNTFEEVAGAGTRNGGTYASGKPAGTAAC